MLSKETFEKGIKMLTTEYKDFKMSKERKNQWYKYLKNMSDDIFISKISKVLKNINRPPFMADIYNAYPDIGYLEPEDIN